ncbi:rhodanese-like domain-containing protein [Nitrosomonas supralitoralis]|uniref:Sulfurtransferase n=1 Tax=Nitrosomonas supralitoralis TaxID=2116706 RepID=A0A2P7NSU7_9PROT|nr:rhodanese-like domain-containing protein [Nitrosomonas supralitoralis]PSJ16536.1 sulfurtransferase [Nitrosomonas supralitoralis]
MRQHNLGFLRLVEQKRKRIKECTVSDLQDRLSQSEQFYFVDVREDHEFWVDHAANARHLGKGIIERDIETEIPDKEALIVLYCGGGYRSVLVADVLQLMGYKNVLSLAGGIKALRDAGFPLEKGVQKLVT